MTYAHHVFVSYRRIGSIKHWVPQVLLPVLRDHLENELGDPAEVYCDVTHEAAGNRWPESLAAAHAGSCVIVPVLSHGYFQSGWCVSEWRNACAREQLVGPTSKAWRAVVPVWFNNLTEGDIDGLPEELRDQVRARVREDLRLYNALHQVDVHSAMQDAYAFRKTVQKLCEDVIAPAVKAAPEPSASWPRLPQDPISGQDPSWRPRL